MKVLRGDKKAQLMLGAKVILALSPHPDDVELIAGGFLSYSKNENKEIYLIVVTDGSLGYKDEKLKDDISKIRVKEQEEAGKILGIKEIIFLNYKDTQSPEPRFLRNDIIKYITLYKPDLVLTIDPYLRYESHPDHLNTGFAALQAVYLSGIIHKITPPNIALGASDSPNVYLELDEREFRDKIAAISCFKSQFDDAELVTYSFSYTPEFPDKIVEAFRVLTPKELHMTPYKDL